MFIKTNKSRSHSESANCQRKLQQCIDADAPSYSSTLRIGFENVRTLRDIRLGQLHRRWNAASSSIPKAMQIGSSIRPMLCRCLFNGQCPLMSPTKFLKLDLGSLSKYLVKPGLGFFSHILDWRQAVSKLYEAQCDLSNHSRSIHLTLGGCQQNLVLLLQVRRPPYSYCFDLHWFIN
jgi:hypothetical protein